MECRTDIRLLCPCWGICCICRECYHCQHGLQDWSNKQTLNSQMYTQIVYLFDALLGYSHLHRMQLRHNECLCSHLLGSLFCCLQDGAVKFIESACSTTQNGKSTNACIRARSAHYGLRRASHMLLSTDTFILYRSTAPTLAPILQLLPPPCPCCCGPSSIALSRGKLSHSSAASTSYVICLSNAICKYKM